MAFLYVYGIPTCATCKKALAWLAAEAPAGLAYEWVNTRELPPDRAAIAQWVEQLGFGPLRNTSGQAYRALGPERQTWGAAEWVEAFAADAMLLKRPLFVRGGRAIAVGFRPDDAAWRSAVLADHDKTR